MELLKWLNDDNRRRLLSLINTWWVTKLADVELFQARVVPIFKKGEKTTQQTTDPSLYLVLYIKFT